MMVTMDDPAESPWGLELVWACGHRAIALGHAPIGEDETRPHPCPVCFPSIARPGCCDGTEYRDVR